MNIQVMKKTCPVCAMQVEKGSYSEIHTGIQYLFCSSQCLDNFRAHPLLYTGKNAVHQQTRLMQRRFKLEKPLDGAQLSIVCEELSAMMGIEQVEITRNKINLTYDLFQCTARQVEECLEHTGVHLGQGWSAKFKRGWMKYTEENELDHLIATPQACCNRPPAKR